MPGFRFVFRSDDQAVVVNRTADYDFMVPIGGNGLPVAGIFRFDIHTTEIVTFLAGRVVR